MSLSPFFYPRHLGTILAGLRRKIHGHARAECDRRNEAGVWNNKITDNSHKSTDETRFSIALDDMVKDREQKTSSSRIFETRSRK